MNIYSIPNLVENNVSTFLDSISAIDYKVTPSFSVDDYTLPCIVVKAGKFTPLAPSTGVYNGSFAVTVITQIDEPTALETHDLTVGEALDAMESPSLFESFNQSGNAWSCNLASVQNDREDRALITLLEYDICCQNLTIND